MDVVGRELELFFPVLGLKIQFHTICLFIDTLITNTTIHCANTLVDSEKSFKGLQFGLDWVFKYSEFVPILGFASDKDEFLVLENPVRSSLSAFKYYIKNEFWDHQSKLWGNNYPF